MGTEYEHSPPQPQGLRQWRPLIPLRFFRSTAAAIGNLFGTEVFPQRAKPDFEFHHKICEASLAWAGAVGLLAPGVEDQHDAFVGLLSNRLQNRWREIEPEFLNLLTWRLPFKFQNAAVACGESTRLAADVLVVGEIYEVMHINERDGYYALSGLGRYTMTRFELVSAAEAGDWPSRRRRSPAGEELNPS